MLRFLAIALFVVLAGLAVIFNQEIRQFSDTFVTTKEAQNALKQGDTSEALRVYSENVKKHPDNIDLSLALASLYQQEGEKGKAVAVYQTLLKHHPGYLPAILAYGRLQQETPEKRNTILTIYRKALKTNPRNPQLLSDAGDLYLKAADNEQETRLDMKNWLYDWAIYFYRQSLQYQPEAADTYFNLGVAYQQTRRLEKSATSYCNAVALNPEMFEGRYNLGLTLVGLGALSEGYKQMARAIELLSRNDRMDEAQALAERVQLIKNMVYNHNQRDFQQEANSQALQTFLSPDCLMNKAQPSEPVSAGSVNEKKRP